MAVAVYKSRCHRHPLSVDPDRILYLRKMSHIQNSSIFNQNVFTDRGAAASVIDSPP